MGACPSSLHTRIARFRKVAYDVAHMGAGTAGEMYVKEAERNARNGNCDQARKELRLGVGAIRRSLKKYDRKARRRR